MDMETSFDKNRKKRKLKTEDHKEMTKHLNKIKTLTNQKEETKVTPYRVLLNRYRELGIRLKEILQTITEKQTAEAALNTQKLERKTRH